MSSHRAILGAVLAGALLAGPAAFAQTSTVTGQTMRATEGMKSRVIEKNAEEVIKEQKKAASDEKSKTERKAMQKTSDTEKKMGMEKKPDGGK